MFCPVLASIIHVSYLHIQYLEYVQITNVNISRHTVVCCAAQEAGMPPVSILTGRKKTQFSHLCSSVIPYPIGTKFAREVPASKGSLHTKFIILYKLLGDFSMPAIIHSQLQNDTKVT